MLMDVYLEQEYVNKGKDLTLKAYSALQHLL